MRNPSKNTIKKLARKKLVGVSADEMSVADFFLYNSVGATIYNMSKRKLMPWTRTGLKKYELKRKVKHNFLTFILHDKTVGMFEKLHTECLELSKKLHESAGILTAFGFRPEPIEHRLHEGNFKPVGIDSSKLMNIIAEKGVVVVHHPKSDLYCKVDDKTMDQYKLYWQNLPAIKRVPNVFCNPFDLEEKP